MSFPGDINAVSYGELRAEVRRLIDDVRVLTTVVGELKTSAETSSGFNKALAVVAGAVGGIASPLLGWAVGLIHLK